MKVGLLICDHVPSKFQKEFRDYPYMFQALFPNYDFKLYNAMAGELPTNVEECPVYMATGSVHSAYEDLDWIHQTKAFIKSIAASNSYFIGVCFGHQLMAEALGGKVEKADVGWCIGVHQFDVYHIKSWMRPAKSSVNCLMMCQDQVVQLPENTQILAGNADCPNAIIQIGSKMLGIQGHPEFPKAYDKILMELRVEKMGKEKVAKGIESLRLDIDLDLFRSWVDNFINGK